MILKSAQSLLYQRSQPQEYIKNSPLASSSYTNKSTKTPTSAQAHTTSTTPPFVKNPQALKLHLNTRKKYIPFKNNPKPKCQQSVTLYSNLQLNNWEMKEEWCTNKMLLNHRMLIKMISTRLISVLRRLYSGKNCWGRIKCHLLGFIIIKKSTRPSKKTNIKYRLSFKH